MATLRLEGVRFAYGAREVLAGVTVEVGPGERVAVVGPNGAGKSTLLRVASGHLTPSAGRVLLDGRDLAGLPRREAARQVGGMASEESHDFPFTVRESVALGRHPWRGAFRPPSAADREAVEGALAVAHLVDLAERPLPSLSSGERQRAALARSLAQGAGLLLLDEPTAHLDLGHQVRLLDVVRAHVEGSSRAALAVLHDLNLASAWATRVVLLHAGTVLADGAPRDVLTGTRVAEAFGAEVHLVAHPEGGPPLLVPRSPR